MAEFFRGWRRKVGCLTLAMACVFAAGWTRGLYFYDSLEFRFQRLNVSLHLTSSPGRVGLGIATGKHPRGYFTFHALSVHEVEEIDREKKHREELQKQYEKDLLVDSELELQSELEPENEGSYLFGLVDIGTYGGGSGDFPVTINYGGPCIGTHYAVVVLPLTHLSAWLLLSKPRPAKKPEPARPLEPDHA